MASASDVAFKGIKDQLDKYLSTKKVSEQTRKVIGAIFDHSKDYYELCEAIGENPNSKAALAKFLLQKSIFVSNISGNESAECYGAIAGFVIDAWQFKAGFATPVTATATIGIAFLDALEVGNSCNFAQAWYYDTYLNPKVKISAIRQEVQKDSVSSPGWSLP